MCLGKAPSQFSFIFNQQDQFHYMTNVAHFLGMPLSNVTKGTQSRSTLFPVKGIFKV